MDGHVLIIFDFAVIYLYHPSKARDGWSPASAEHWIFQGQGLVWMCVHYKSLIVCFSYGLGQ